MTRKQRQIRKYIASFRMTRKEALAHYEHMMRKDAVADFERTMRGRR